MDESNMQNSIYAGSLTMSTKVLTGPLWFSLREIKALNKDLASSLSKPTRRYSICFGNNYSSILLLT